MYNDAALMKICPTTDMVCPTASSLTRTHGHIHMYLYRIDRIGTVVSSPRSDPIGICQTVEDPDPSYGC